MKKLSMSKSKGSITPPKQVLDYKDLDSWPGRIKGFLIDFKNLALRGLQQQVKSDRSAPPEVLVGIEVINRVLPCPVELYQLDSFSLLRFRLGKGSFEYKVQKKYNELIKSIIDSGADTFWEKAFDRRNQDVWMVIPKGRPVEMNISYSMMLNQALDYMITKANNRLRNIRQQKLSEIGFRLIKLRTPSGNPDTRIQAVSRMTDGQLVQLVPQDLINDMEQCSRLLTICPDEIEQVMQRARLLYVNAYCEWEFFTISVHYAVLALEASLRAIYDEWIGTENVEVTATIQQKPIIKTISGPRDKILKWVNLNQASNVIARGHRFPRNKPQLLEHAVTIGVLSKWEKEECTYLLSLRDTFSHPTGTFTDWISWTTGNILESCQWINLMWARFYKKLPIELTGEMN